MPSSFSETRLLSTMLDPDLISLLRCPATKQPLRVATEEEKRRHGSPVDEAALVTEDGTRLYRTEIDFPILLSANDAEAAG
jgi:uncharacterized protein YbaR (Trm112 family)